MSILSVSENILFFICGLGILQGILLAAIIYYHPKSDRSVSTFLALYIYCLSSVMTMPFIVKSIGWQNSFFLEPLPLLVGPLLYLYLRSFKEGITWRKALPHFLFPVIFFFLAYLFLFPIGKKYPDAEEVPAEALQHPLAVFLTIIKHCQLILYYFLARRTLIHYQRSIRHLYSETSRIDLQWARLLVNGYMLIVCATIVIVSLMIMNPEYFNLLFLINIALATPYIYIATFKGIMQPTIWQIQPGINKEEVEEEMVEAEEIEMQKVSHEKSALPKAGSMDNKIDEIVRKIIVLMEEEKLYQETELTLQQLSAKLQFPTYQVSQAINEGMKRNFYDLINSYRVEEAKRLLLDPGSSNFTILSIGFDAGFNSKTTFNTVFKKFTGLTPTDFRGRQKAGLVHA